jgi:hypothetical protein
MTVSPLRFSALAFEIIALVCFSRLARADVQSHSGVEERNADGGLLGPRAAAPLLTKEQFAAFAEMLGEPRAVIWQRLQVDPTLASSAVAAAEARLQRKRTGKMHTAVGFSIFGVGAITGYILISTAFQPVGGGVSIADDRIALGLVVLAASAGVGLPLGIDGIVKMSRQSEAETATLERYQKPQMPSALSLDGSASSAAPTGYSVKVPLLSLCF